MMWLKMLILVFIIGRCRSMSSPISVLAPLKYSVELEKDVADLWWDIDDAKGEITFELHVKTTGWISLGISPSGGMKGADIVVGWIDNFGSVHVEDRYAFGFTRPIVDNTTEDWIALKGQESDGWTAIQFKRLLDTCDPMDYPIKSGSNILIYAYGLVDPDQSEISYHETRRNTRIIPLRSYAQPPREEKFVKLDYFDLRLENYSVPWNDTTYHCKVYKVPGDYSEKRHAIAYQVLVDEKNIDLVHHLLLHECNPSFSFDDENLPDGICDEIYEQVEPCSVNIATGWAVGGDQIVEFVREAGYPIGKKSPNQYLMIQMHYDNPKRSSTRRDSSGIRFYLGDELRQYDLAYLTFGTLSSAVALAIPPKVEKFIVDSYCPSTATKNIPESGLTIFAAFPHTHLQGVSMWTKIIRNKTAVEYLFNAESYQFNYQFENRLPKTIKIYPGDEFATRCIYNTVNKDGTTVGGEKTEQEMCLHFFTYYPRMEDFSACYTMNTVQSLQNQINSSSEFNYTLAKEWLVQRNWTRQLSEEWQEYYHNAPRMNLYVQDGKQFNEYLGILPEYQDLEPTQCEK